MGWNCSSSAWRNCTGLNHLSVCKTDWTMLLLMLAAMWWTFDWLFNDQFLALENYIILMMIYLHLVMSIFNSIQLWLCSGHVDHQHIVSGTSLRKRVFSIMQLCLSDFSAWFDIHTERRDRFRIIEFHFSLEVSKPFLFSASHFLLILQSVLECSECWLTHNQPEGGEKSYKCHKQKKGEKI